MKFRYITLMLLVSLFSTGTFAQIEMPAASPTFELSGKIGLAQVKVVYSRPSTNDRKVFGDLVPYGELWRTGANASTKLSFDMNVEIEGNKVPAGDYALYTIPGEKEWTIILSKNTELWGSMGYEQEQDLLRFQVPAQSVSSHYETFTISFSDFTTKSAYLNMKWEKSKAKFQIVNDTDEYVMTQIKEKLIDNESERAGDYYASASYYYQTERDMKLALGWIDKFLETEEKYWGYHLKAKILARLGNKKEAIAAANKSKELAGNGVNPDYVRLNEKLIAGLE